MPEFVTNYKEILDKLDAIDPLAYGKTRNYLNGAVTYLSPYISRGVISTKMVLEKMEERGFNPFHIGKFVQELAWRDYWQQVWLHKDINTDLKQPQMGVKNTQISEVIVNANTGINAIDAGIKDLYITGYMHNHLRMYVAAMACNMAGSHWKTPAQWMYYHLLDADWASNALSWQWVAGANASKKYVANQENINNFCATNQFGTFLDVPYESFDNWNVPAKLETLISPDFNTNLPKAPALQIDAELPTCIYNFYNMDPAWRRDIQANRILLLVPSIFRDYPISQQSMDFLLQLGKNIDGLQIYVGEFNELKALLKGPIYFKEHPLNKYEGIEDARDWMFDVKGYYPSFFGYWKKCKKELAASYKEKLK